jgi:hypothetical protein
MATNSGNEPSFFARYIDGLEKERLEPRKILMGGDTILEWMQLCIDADAIKLEKEAENSRALNLGSDHKPAWIATHYLYESYLATCRQQGTWYPVLIRGQQTTIIFRHLGFSLMSRWQARIGDLD